MQTLFTPWRYSYLISPKGDQQCIFCLASSSSDTESTLALYRGHHVVAMLNRFPYSNGHVMVAPVAHQARLFDTEADVLHALIRVTAEAQRILSDTYQPNGFNIGMNFGEVAGAGFADHYHLHIVPRWSGDVNFMAVTAGTRLVPETLETTFDRLRPKFAAMKADFSAR